LSNTYSRVQTHESTHFLFGARCNFVSIEKTPYDVANFIFRGQNFRPQHNITYEDGAFRFTYLRGKEERRLATATKITNDSGLNDALIQHGVGNLQEAGHVGAFHIVDVAILLSAMLPA